MSIKAGDKVITPAGKLGTVGHVDDHCWVCYHETPEGVKPWYHFPFPAGTLRKIPEPAKPAKDPVWQAVKRRLARESYPKRSDR